MRTIALTDAGLALRAKGDLLTVHRGGEQLDAVPVSEVEEVVCFGFPDISSTALAVLLRRGVDLVYLTADGRLRGRLVGPVSAWPARRVAQYRLQGDDEQRLAVAVATVSAKVRAQARVLKLRARRVHSEPLDAAREALQQILTSVAGAPTVESARGFEGMAAQRYFGVFGDLVGNPDFVWTGRNRRPPRDPLNAMLSFGYALLLTRVEAAVRRAGLDPYLGVLHGHLRGAPSAALDLAEPYRPLVDAMVLTLVNRRAVALTDFELPPPGVVPDAEADSAVYLGRLGRRALVRAWVDLRQNTPLQGQDGGRRRLDDALDVEVHRLRRFLERFDADYVPWFPASTPS